MVLFVGKFANWKRLDAVLQSAKVYEKSDPKICTVIAGTGGPKDILKYHSMAYEKLGLKNTYFVGSMSQVQLRELCTVADIGVFPSKKEPFGMVFIECMACGTPVIGAASGGPVSFVTEEVGKLVPESEDVASFSKVLCKTIMQALEEDWKTEKKAACLELVEKYTMEKQCKQIKEKVLALITKDDKVDEETRAKVRAYYKFLNTGSSDQTHNYYSSLDEERQKKAVGV
jgi:glycosyltransferase involved in cell wall biosynthesis